MDQPNYLSKASLMLAIEDLKPPGYDSAGEQEEEAMDEETKEEEKTEEVVSQDVAEPVEAAVAEGAEQ